MNEHTNKLLREVCDLLREQNTLIAQMRDMNRESVEQLWSNQERSERLTTRTEAIQSKTERAFSFGNVVLYGAAIVIVLLLFKAFASPW